jgi:hypothetical protein
LRPNEEQLLALNMADFGPIHGQCAQNVVDTDIERVGTKPFDFAGDVVTILHDDNVGFFPPEER